VTPLSFSKSVDINAAPDAVFAVMSDVERWPEWTASVTSVKRLDAGSFAVGSRARIRQPKLPPALWTVSAIEPGHSFTWISKGPGILVTAHHSVEPRAGGSHVSLSIRYHGVFAKILAWMTKDINQRYLAMEAAGLKARCEKA
jgi:uncharacterized membrane protein